MVFKVQFFWEDHENFHNLLMVFTFNKYLIVKTVRMIAQICVAFSEKLNFMNNAAALNNGIVIFYLLGWILCTKFM